MGRFHFEIPKEFQEKLQRLENIDEIAPKMIDEATPILEEAIRNRLELHKDTGALQKSLKKIKAKRTKSGAYYGSIVFKGKVIRNGKATSNYLKAIVLEYGSSKQPPRPFIKASIADCEKEVKDKMQEVFEREVGI
jgi:HK97 gp10 family phage protein